MSNEEGPPMRLEEVPDLKGREDDLAGLRVDDVMIRPVEVDGAVQGWLALVLLSTRYTMEPVPWMLGLRPSEDEARAAVTMLLKGILKAQKRTRRDHPAVRPVDDEPREAMCRVLDEMKAEWRDRRWPRTKTAMGTAQPMQPSMARLSEEHRQWGEKVRATRKAWGWTQVILAEKVGIDAPRLSKIERGKLLPPDDVQAKLCEVLDLDPPKALRELASDG